MDTRSACVDMPLSELLCPDSAYLPASASQQTAEVLQLLRRLEALNRCALWQESPFRPPCSLC